LRTSRRRQLPGPAAATGTHRGSRRRGAIGSAAAATDDEPGSWHAPVSLYRPAKWDSLRKGEGNGNKPAGAKPVGHGSEESCDPGTARYNAWSALTQSLDPLD